VSTLLAVYQNLCTDGLLPDNRRKDILTALKYLAASYETTPDKLPLIPEVEETYRQRLRTHLASQDKGRSTIRNSMQGIGQYLKAFHQLQQTPPVTPVKPRAMRYDQARIAIAETSPYKHAAWMTASPYRLPIERWPSDCCAQYERFRVLRKDLLRTPTLTRYLSAIESHLGYLSMTGEQRLDRLPSDARKKLQLKTYRDDMQMVTALPVLSAWDDLFDIDGLKSFVTWHSWRIHTAFDAQVREKPPSKPSTRAYMLLQSILGIAQTLERPEAATIRAYVRSMEHPKRVHNKQAEHHTFTFAELERVALTLMDEARRMVPDPYNVNQYPGARAAERFLSGLVLMMGWRVPIRVRNWSEALLDSNLRKVNGSWHWHFEGSELKIGTRAGETNVFDVKIAGEVVPYLEEYLHHWRPLLPRASEDRHVLLKSKGTGGLLPIKDIYMKLRLGVYRHTGKRLYPHLLRTIFTSNMISSGVDINSVAYGLNDRVATVLASYNELQAGKHQQSLQDAYERALNGTGKTP
jgi:hypothetical protein